MENGEYDQDGYDSQSPKRPDYPSFIIESLISTISSHQPSQFSLQIKHQNKRSQNIPAPPAIAAAPLVPAVNPKRPFPPVDVLAGSESLPSEPMASATMLEPAGLLSRKYAAALGLGLPYAGAAALRAGRMRERERVEKCMLNSQNVSDRVAREL